jgi:hypothetical protein
MKCKSSAGLVALVLFSVAVAGTARGGENSTITEAVPSSSSLEDSSVEQVDQPSYRNAWGLDILVSNDGFGLGTFYRREFNEDLFGFATFSISEAKDDREFEQFNPYYPYQSIVPGKLQRFLVMPLLFGVQNRLFREDIADNFRPFINAGAGPALILSAPFMEFATSITGDVQASQVDFFKSLGRAKAHYTLAAFIGVGANFGTEKANVLGVNFRYYFTYLFGKGLPSLYKEGTAGEVLATKSSFGGFFITLNVGMAY